MKQPATNVLNLKSPELKLLILGLLFHIFLVVKSLLPSLGEINLWDEADYLNAGRVLLAGELPVFAWNPLVSAFHGLTYLPFANSQFWMVQSAALGRLLLFILIWGAAYTAARQTKQHASPWITLSLLVLMPVSVSILRNQSDSLFAAMSGFALAKFIAYIQHRDIRQLVWASFFVGLAALSRNDGLVLFLIFLVLASLCVLRFGQGWRAFAAASMPFVALVLGYMVVYWAATGEFTLGTGGRTYVAFQQGYIVDYQPGSECLQSSFACAAQGSEAVFGDAASNQDSVFVAILNNPQAYLSHLGAMFAQLPRLLVQAFGSKTAVVFFLFLGRGVWQLIRQKDYWLLSVLALWPAYLLVYIFTFFREGYFQTSLVPLYILAAIGVQGLLQDLSEQDKGPKVKFSPAVWVWTLGLLALALFGFWRQNVGLYFAAVVLLLGIWLVLVAQPLMASRANPLLGAALVLLSIGLILRGSLYDPPPFRRLGDTAEEAASVALQEQFPAGSLLAAGARGTAWAARLEYYSLSDARLVVDSPEELHAIFLSEGVDAVYVDHNLSAEIPAVWNNIEIGIGTLYERIYSGKEGSIQVLRIVP